MQAPNQGHLLVSTRAMPWRSPALKKVFDFIWRIRDAERPIREIVFYHSGPLITLAV
jgi:hypothetical protein